MSAKLHKRMYTCLTLGCHKVGSSTPKLECESFRMTHLYTFNSGNERNKYGLDQLLPEEGSIVTCI